MKTKNQIELKLKKINKDISIIPDDMKIPPHLFYIRQTLEWVLIDEP